MVLLSFLNANWFMDLFDSTPTPPIKIPINLTKAKNKISLEFRINDPWSYYLKLEFYSKNQDLDGGLDVGKARMIAGFNSYEPYNGKQLGFATYEQAKRQLAFKGIAIDKNYNLDGTVIPLKVTIYKLEDNKRKLFLQKSYDTKGYSGGGYDEKQKKDAISREFGYVSFKDKGKYLIVIENLKSFPELKGRDIRFSIYRTRKYK